MNLFVIGTILATRATEKDQKATITKQIWGYDTRYWKKMPVKVERGSKGKNRIHFCLNEFKICWEVAFSHYQHSAPCGNIHRNKLCFLGSKFSTSFWRIDDWQLILWMDIYRENFLCSSESCFQLYIDGKIWHTKLTYQTVNLSHYF